jgi:hypothetical protein
MPAQSASIGDTRTTSGVCIGGWNGTRLFYGEIQEVAIYQIPIKNGNTIRNLMFSDQSGDSNIKGYFKLGFQTDSATTFTNYAINAPSDAKTGSKQGSGEITSQLPARCSASCSARIMPGRRGTRWQL